MRKTVISIFGALLISGLAAQVAAASEQHGRKAYDRSDLRRAYNQVLGPVDTAPRIVDRPDASGFGFGGRDPSWVGGNDPSFNPSGS